MSEERIDRVWLEQRLLFMGTQTEVVTWLTKDDAWRHNVRVEVQLGGGTRVPVIDYLRGIRMAEEASKHARDTTVLHLVRSAMSKQDAATYHGESSDGMDIVAKQTAEAIIKLFEGE